MSTESKANARLIAAAPNMLLALEQVAVWMDAHKVGGALSEIVGLAIAKAEGK